MAMKIIALIIIKSFFTMYLMKADNNLYQQEVNNISER